jgi:hypothetical protein
LITDLEDFIKGFNTALVKIKNNIEDIFKRKEESEKESDIQKKNKKESYRE